MKHVSRRDFLKGAAALTGMTAMSMTGIAVAEQKDENKVPRVKVAVFSPTEGTKNAAALVASKFSHDVTFADLTTIPAREVEVSFEDADLAIFAAPAYGAQAPKIKGLFSNVKGNQTPCIVVAAYGNRDAVNVKTNLAKIAADQGFIVIGAIELITPHVFSSNAKVGHSRPNVDDGYVINEFADKIKSKLEQGQIEAVTLEGNPEIDFDYVIRISGEKGFNAENCTKCGKCITNCPVGAIDASTMQVNEDICLKCQRCSYMCEFNARTYDTSIFRESLEGGMSIKKPVQYFV